MTLELAFKRSLVPNFAKKREDETPLWGTKRIHWVGDRGPAQPGQDQNQSGNQDHKPGKRLSELKRDARGYRDLSTIMLGEVSDAYKAFAAQLLPNPYPGWVGTNYFCMLDLVRKHGYPPAIFGRVKTCYPSDGYIQNIQDLELLLPQKEKAPDVVLLNARDIRHDPQHPFQSYCMRVKFLVSEEDLEEFNGYENLFFEQGLMAEFDHGYIDLLDIHEQNQATLPWFYVIGSRWFASIPNSMRFEVREQLAKLIHLKKWIFNYHPERLTQETRTLNRELGYKFGFTEFALIEPETPEQTAQIVASTFEKLFQNPIK